MVNMRVGEEYIINPSCRYGDFPDLGVSVPAPCRSPKDALAAGFDIMATAGYLMVST